MPAYKDKAKGTWYASFYYENVGRQILTDGSSEIKKQRKQHKQKEQRGKREATARCGNSRRGTKRVFKFVSKV